jgi:hypothetical protein
MGKPLCTIASRPLGYGRMGRNRASSDTNPMSLEVSSRDSSWKKWALRRVGRLKQDAAGLAVCARNFARSTSVWKWCQALTL